MNITYYALGIKFFMPASVIETRIMAMGSDEFIAYAKQFIPNPSHPCSCYTEPANFKSIEEWEKYEIEGNGHRLIRQENGVKLYWEGDRLHCLVGYPLKSFPSA